MCSSHISSSLLAVAAEKDGTPVFKFTRWRVKGQPIPDVVDAYKSVGAELNVMPFCSQFIPMNVIDHPRHGSIIYHPSILPLHRGASAINWWEGETIWKIKIACCTSHYYCHLCCWIRIAQSPSALQCVSESKSFKLVLLSLPVCSPPWLLLPVNNYCMFSAAKLSSLFPIKIGIFF